jgi:hypothetical protein
MFIHIECLDVASTSGKNVWIWILFPHLDISNVVYLTLAAPCESHSVTLDDLTVNFSHLDRKALLASWAWKIGDTMQPILVAASGDVFVQSEIDESVSVLETAAGKVSLVAKSPSEFSALLANKKFVYDYFAVVMIADLLKSGQRLGKSQIFSFKVPPVLGGEYVLSNIEPTDVEVHFSITGQIHEKVSRLPPGTKIQGVTIS